MHNRPLFFALSLAVAACSSSYGAEEAAQPGPSLPGDAPPGAPSASGPSGPSQPGAPSKHPVQGKLVDYSGAPTAGARVRVVDVKGNVQDTTSNASGAFSFADVPTPYDLRVLPAEGVEGYPQAYLGLTQTELRVTFSAGATAPTSNKGIITVPVNVGPCPSCTVQIFTTSPGGRYGGLGRNGFSTGNTPSTTTVSVEHAWQTIGNPVPSGTVTIDVLVSDAAFTTFQYKRVTSGELQPDGTLSVATMSPTPIGKFGPITIMVSNADVPADWNKDLRVFLKLPGTQFSMGLQEVSSHALVTNVPNVPGATFDVAASARLTKYDADRNRVVDRYASTTTPELPLSTANVTPSLHIGPAMVRPLPEGELSLQSAGLAWTMRQGRVVDLDLANLTTSKSVARLVTSETSIPFTRLAKLGVTLEAGTHAMDLNTFGGTVGDAVAPTPAPSSSGEWTHDSYRFAVTP